MDDRGTLTPRALFLYRDSPLRREALASPPGAAARYSLYGLDELAAAGWSLEHNLVPERAPSAALRRAALAANRGLERAGGYGGDFASVLASRREIGRADVVFSTVDTVGLPLVLLRSARAVPRTPVVYASIGLPQRLAQLRGERMRRRYLRAIGDVDAVVAYGHAEAGELRDWLSQLATPPRVAFVPFGVDPGAFAPLDVEPAFDVVSVGADPQRDHGVLADLVARTPDLSYAVVAAAGQAAELDGMANARVDLDVPFAEIPGRLASGRVVVLPVRENSYSGATTTLLQAMAMARPVVVSRVGAIADGYGLVDGENCRLVEPGDAAASEHAVRDLLAGPEAARALGARAREHVERHLSWRRYTAALAGVLETAGRPAPDG